MSLFYLLHVKCTCFLCFNGFLNFPFPLSFVMSIQFELILWEIQESPQTLLGLLGAVFVASDLVPAVSLSRSLIFVVHLHIISNSFPIYFCFTELISSLWLHARIKVVPIGLKKASVWVDPKSHQILWAFIVKHLANVRPRRRNISMRMWSLSSGVKNVIERKWQKAQVTKIRQKIAKYIPLYKELILWVTLLSILKTVNSLEL